MIQFKGLKFAENESEFTDSLFQSGGTCVGYAKRLKRQVKFFDMQHNIIAVINKWGVLCKANTLKDGKIWYNYGDIDLFKGMGYMEQQEHIDNLRTGIEWTNNNEMIYKFN